MIRFMMMMSDMNCLSRDYIHFTLTIPVVEKPNLMIVHLLVLGARVTDCNGSCAMCV